MLKFCRRSRDFILDILFPIECLNCRQEGAYLCPNCLAKLKFNDETYLKTALANLKISDLKKIYIAGDYESSILHNLIIKYKYSFISPLGKILADFLILFWKKISPIFTSDATPFLVIPIPLSKKRERWRGFNQAEVISRNFSVYFNYELNLDLKRIKHRPPQAELSEIERLKNIESVFAWQGKNLQAYHILLIDDVVTSGATLNEAARVLKAAGAKNVYALVLAKG